jgi:hypothetical protein
MNGSRPQPNPDWEAWDRRRRLHVLGNLIAPERSPPPAGPGPMTARAELAINGLLKTVVGLGQVVNFRRGLSAKLIEARGRVFAKEEIGDGA